METSAWNEEDSDPHEVWVEVKDFPGYSVSDYGRVRNDETGRILSVSPNQYGVLRVGMMNRDRHQENRSLSLLVAKHHIETPPDNSVFDTPINLDGDRHNNRASNLMWRPLWFARKYHQQFEDGARTGYNVPIQVLSTGDIFPNSMSAATRFGILAEDTVKSILNHTYVFPTFQKFKVLEDHHNSLGSEEGVT